MSLLGQKGIIVLQHKSELLCHDFSDTILLRKSSLASYAKTDRGPPEQFRYRTWPFFRAHLLSAINETRLNQRIYCCSYISRAFCTFLFLPDVRTISISFTISRNPNLQRSAPQQQLPPAQLTSLQITFRHSPQHHQHGGLSGLRAIGPATQADAKR